MENSTNGNSGHRDEILEALAAGDNTFREIADRTKIPLSTIVHECELLDKIYLTIRPGLPCVTVWLKGKEPVGEKLVRREGRIVRVPIEGLDEDMKADLIDAGNEKLRQAGAPVEYDLAKTTAPAGDVHCQLPLEDIILHPLNPRGPIDTNDQDFQNFLASVLEVGVQQPLIVTPHDNTGKFRVVMGNRRRTAAEKAGLSSVPCLVRQYASPEAELVVMLIENIQRAGLKPMQEARAFLKLYHSNGKDINAVARLVGLTQSYIQTSLRLMKLDETIQQMVDRRELGRGAAALIATLDKSDQIKVAPRAVRMKGADVRDLVHRTKEKLLAPPKWKPERKRVTTDEEKFTRSNALKTLEGMGDTWFNADHIKASFDDVCIQTCLESRDETYCHACPIPRLIASLARRVQTSAEVTA